MLVNHVDLRDFTLRVVRHAGTPADIAEDVADVLVAADLRGITSHGTSRLSMYIAQAEAGLMDPGARPERVAGTPALGLWDANNGWGPHAGRVVMDDAVQRAQALGIAVGVVRHANHYGIAGWYAMRAASVGLIGLSMTNGTPLVAPTRGKTKMIGTNPIAFAAPAGRFGSMVLDMATSAITWGRLLVENRRGGHLATGVAMDRHGRPTDSPAAVLDDGALVALGGGEDTAGYKGYGLALMVDVLTGVLSGAASGPAVPGFSLTGSPSDLGQLFLALDPRSLGSGGFEQRLETLIDGLKNSPTADGAPGPVLYPGEPEGLRTMAQEAAGIALDPGHHGMLLALADRLGVEFPSTRPFGRTESKS